MVLPFKHGPFWNFSYVVACSETHRAVIIDPAWDVETLLTSVRERALEVAAVVLTHGHSDHSHGVADVVQRCGARVIAHEAEAPEVRRTYSGPIESLNAATTIRIGTLDVVTLHTPGHTAGSLSFLAEGQLFTGDALHVGGIGRTGPEAGALEAQWHSFRTVFASLPGETIIRPGHDAGPSARSTLAVERQRISALTADSFEEFVSFLGR